VVFAVDFDVLRSDAVVQVVSLDESFDESAITDVPPGLVVPVRAYTHRTGATSIVDGPLVCVTPDVEGVDLVNDCRFVGKAHGVVLRWWRPAVHRLLRQLRSRFLR